jgi:hypothetical protein
LSVCYYIYYRVTVPAEAEPFILELQAHLASDTGIRGRLLQKHDEPTLWMEIYEGVTDPVQFETVLERLVGAAQFQSLLHPGSARTVEKFVDRLPGRCV